MNRALVSIAASLGAFVASFGSMAAFASSASAFCRSTTCRATATKECPKDDEGCPTQGAKLYWPTSCVSYSTNELGTQQLDPVETRDLIRKTFRAWSDVPCKQGGNASMTFQEREPVSCKKSEYNKSAPNLNVILFQDDNWNYRGIDGTLAKTSVTFNDETGEIYDADIEVNAANNTLTITDDPKKVDYDLEAILTHEVGHFIGIGHSSDDGAVMFESYSPGSIGQRELTEDDIAAVCAIYPPNSGVVCNPEPRFGYSPTCGPTPGAGGSAAPPKEGCSVSTVGPGASRGTAGEDRAGDAMGAAAIGLGLVTMASAARTRRRIGARRES